MTSDGRGTPLNPALAGLAAVAALAPDDPPKLRRIDRAALGSMHSHAGGRAWRVAPDGIHTSDEGPHRTRGEPTSVRLYLAVWGEELRAVAWDQGVPVALLLMTICTENGGAKLDGQRLVYPAERREPGFTSYEATPHKVSFGPCHVLLSTARAALGDRTLTARDCMDPGVNIRAMAAYVAQQFDRTGFDPILVAAAYNAGSVKTATSGKLSNPWRLRSWPGHLDRAAAWYGDAVAVLKEAGQLAALDATGLGRVVV